jgi:aryl-alcohol dehydrogenase-like predicted oxidoreductase
LKTDYLDLYQVHWPERASNFHGIRTVERLDQAHPHGTDASSPTPIEETLEALAEIVKAGKVRHIGLSNESAWGLAEYLRLSREKKLPRVVTIQNQYSLTNRTFEIGLSEMCLHEQVGLLPYSTLNGGVLSGKYLGGVYPAGARHTLTKRNIRYNAPEIQPAVQAYVDLAKAHGLDPAQMALAFANDRAFVTSNIVGATTMEQLKADIASADIVLSPEVMTGIAEIYKVMPDPHA